ncbi:hypothetical protein MMC28_005423 [Mycoblastus sanguinarius]|nr:hypothetical protein [Mycoblastus sanguinarius]
MTKHKDTSAVPHADNTTKPARTTLSALRQDVDICYRIRVLLYDLSNIASDPLSEKRISSTTHELYISEPYFTESEATRIRTALIDDAAEAETTSIQSASSTKDTSISRKEVTIEEAIHDKLIDFFDKRRASGDSRPCGPHDMFPVYGSIFGIQKEELKDEHFLGRLRRSGLGDSRSKEGSATRGKGEIGGMGKKKGGKGS